MGNFYFFIFLRLTWKFLGLESGRGGSVCWPNNKIIDLFINKFVLIVQQGSLGGFSKHTSNKQLPCHRLIASVMEETRNTIRHQVNLLKRNWTELQRTRAFVCWNVRYASNKAAQMDMGDLDHRKFEHFLHEPRRKV